MTLKYPVTNNCFIFMTVFLVISLALQSARANNDEEEDCGNGCQSYDQDTSQMTRCVRYACRRRVFRYFIRFGKRSGMSTEELAREMQKLHFPQYPLRQTLSRRYLKPEMPAQYRYRHLENVENIEEFMDKQTTIKHGIEKLLHFLSSQHKNNHLLRTILDFKRQ